MVQHSANDLDAVFSALGDPTRRAILATLMLGDAKVSDLAGPTAMSLTGLSKHVKVLADAGLITHEKRGRERICRLEPKTMQQAADWIEQYRRFWEDQLDRLAAFLEDEQAAEANNDEQS